MKVGDRVVALCNDTSRFGNVITKDEVYIVVKLLRYNGYDCIEVNTSNAYWLQNDFRLIDEQNFTNALTRKLADEAMEEVKEYVPLIIEQ